jgi:excisionase family DNA binding protein
MMTRYPDHQIETPALTCTILEAAAVLGVSDKSVALLLKRRKLRYFRIGRRVLIPRKELEKLVDTVPTGTYL